MSWPSIYEQKLHVSRWLWIWNKKNKKIALLNWSLTKNYCWNFDFVFILKLNKNFDGKKQKEFLKDSKANIQKKDVSKRAVFHKCIRPFYCFFYLTRFFFCLYFKYWVIQEDFHTFFSKMLILKTITWRNIPLILGDTWFSG